MNNLTSIIETYKRIIMISMGIIILILGTLVTYSGFHSKPPHTPDISHAEIADKNQKPIGPKSTQQINFNNIGKNKLFIPSINVYTNIDDSYPLGRVTIYGLTLPGPSEVTRFYKGSKITSNKGNVLLAGHVSFNGEHGALYNLAKIPLGGIAIASDNNGNRQEYQLVSKVPYKKVKLPDNVWTTNGNKQLIVVTCGGKMERWADGEWHFDSNIVTTWKPITNVVKK